MARSGRAECGEGGKEEEADRGEQEQLCAEVGGRASSIGERGRGAGRGGIAETEAETSKAEAAPPMEAEQEEESFIKIKTIGERKQRIYSTRGRRETNVKGRKKYGIYWRERNKIDRFYGHQKLYTFIEAHGGINCFDENGKLINPISDANMFGLIDRKCKQNEGRRKERR
jgi:hypothetical protein